MNKLLTSSLSRRLFVRAFSTTGAPAAGQAHSEAAPVEAKTPAPPKITKLTDIKKIYGFRGDNEEFFSIDNGEILLKGGKILEVGEKGKLVNSATDEIKLDGGIITPSFVDPHTHAFPPKDRANEFSMRTHMTY